MNTDLDDFIFVDYYEGSYGRTIMMNVPTENLLRDLIHVVDELIKPKPYYVSLETLPFIRMHNIVSFRLHNRRWSSKALEMVHTGGHVAFLWSKFSADWNATIETLNGLTPCSHEYLSEEGIDDALLQVSFKEGLPSLT